MSAGCCRGKKPNTGAATMWRIDTLSGDISKLYDRGANSQCLHAITEPHGRIIYEGGTRTGSGKSVTAWVDNDDDAADVLWEYDPGSTNPTVYDVCRQTDDDSVWVYRAGSGTTVSIDRLNYLTGALINTVNISYTASGSVTGNGLALGDNARVSLWSSFGFAFVPDSAGSTAYVRQYDDTLTNVASFTARPACPRGRVRDGARDGWMTSFGTAAAHDNEAFDTDLASTGFIDNAGATGSVASPIAADANGFVRYTDTGITARWERWTNSTRVWGITITSGENRYDNCMDSDSNFYYSRAARTIKRYSAAAGAVDWTYSYASGFLAHLLCDRDVIVGFGTGSGATINMAAINRATGSELWKKTYPASPKAVANPNITKYNGGTQVLGQHTYVCGVRLT